MIVSIGSGPAGLMAAEEATVGGASVQLYDAMPTVWRTLLVAGKGSLDLTHSWSIVDGRNTGLGSSDGRLSPTICLATGRVAGATVAEWAVHG